MANGFGSILPPDELSPLTDPNYRSSDIRDTAPYGGPIPAGPSPTGLTDFAPKSPQSVLGTDVAPGAQITPKQMPEAERLATHPEEEQAFRDRQDYHNQLRDFGNVKHGVHKQMLEVLHNPYDPDFGHKLATLHEVEGATKEEENRLKLENPWGSAANHPGVMGKIGHVFGEIGNVAGTALAPGLTAAIPGSKLNLEGQVAAGEAERKTGEASELGQEKMDVATQLAEAKGETAGAAKERAAAETTKAQTGKEAQNERAEQAKLLDEFNTRVHDLTAQNKDWRQDPQSQQLAAALQAKQKQAPPAHLGQVPGTVDGKPQFANHDPNTGAFTYPPGHPQAGQTIPNFQPQQGYAQTRPFTQAVMTEDGPQIIQYDPTKKTWSPINAPETGNVSAAGTAGHQMFQGTAIERARDYLINEIEQHKDKMGNPQAIINSALLNTPWSDPETKGLRAQIASFAALNPALHGMRGQGMVEHFEKALGGIPTNPDAFIAGLRGMSLAAEVMTEPLRKAAGGGKNPQRIVITPEMMK